MPLPTYLYYQNAFASNSDAGGGTTPVSIPNTAAVDGSVSYYGGYTDPYEYNLLTNPAALPLTRGVMNQLFYDITNNLQQYQNYGTPMWYSTAQVPSLAQGYPIFARVYYNGVVYENQVSLNMATPGTLGSNWNPISGTSDAIVSGMVIEWAGPIAPAGYLMASGAAVSRTTYANLLSKITQTLAITSTISTTVTLPGGTDALTTMYPGMKVESPNLAAPTTIASVNSNTSITLAAAFTAAGVTTLTAFTWGNGDGSTTFNLPNLNGAVTAGQGGTLVGNASAQVDVVGQSTGSPTHALQPNELAPHTHSTAGGGFIVPSGGASGGSGTSWSSQANTDNGPGSSVPFSIVQPTAVMFKIIKT